MARMYLLLAFCLGGCQRCGQGPQAYVPGGDLAILTNQLPPAYLNDYYTARLAATGGVGPYSWDLAAGVLPQGVVLDSATGEIQGMSAESGDFSFTARVLDSSRTGSLIATKELTISIADIELDRYGGLAAVQSPRGATGVWRTEKLNNRWALVTPAGNAFWMIGVWNVSGDDHTDELGSSYNIRFLKKYGSAQVGWPQANRRLKSWGFNTIGPFSYRMVLPVNQEPEWPGDHTNPVKLPFIGMAYNPDISGRFNGYYKNQYRGLDAAVWPVWEWGANFPDTYDPGYTTYVSDSYANDTNLALYKTSPYFIGYFSDDTDFLAGFGPGVDLPTDPLGKYHWHNGLLALVTSPMQTINPYSTPPNALYADRAVYAKTQLQNFLQQRYGTIDALNAAWGSNYTAFGSTGTAITGGQQFAGGNGTSGPYAATLSSTVVTKYTVLIKVNGVAQGGDDGNGNLVGPGISGGTIDYGAGTISNLTFRSTVAGGTAITADYIQNGWGSGTGLMDENGRSSHTWLGSPINQYTLAGTTAAFQADMNDFLYQMAAKLFSTNRNAFKAVAPNNLFLGVTNLGGAGWRSPARGPILKAAAQSLDILSVGTDCSQAQLDFIAQWAGDVPLMIWEGTVANLDSGRWRSPGVPASWNLSTQALRGQQYQTDVQALFNGTVTATGAKPYVGLLFWSWLDSYGEQMNWGLVSLLDNAYDGKAAISATGADGWGYPTGGEERNYGNFLDLVLGANLSALRTVVTEP